MIRVKKIKFLKRCFFFLVEKNIQSTVSFDFLKDFLHLRKI